MNLVPSIARLVVSRLGRLFASGDDRDAEILALRHQVLVLQRQVPRPRFTETDRTILAALSTVFDRALDRTLIWNQQQLRRLLGEYLEHYNGHRPHRGLDQRAPTDEAVLVDIGTGRTIRRDTTCAGLINEYRSAA